MVVVVLIVPGYLLFDLVRDQNGTLDTTSKGISAIIMLISTLIFSAIMALLARLQKYEILGAAAAYVHPSSHCLCSPVTGRDVCPQKEQRLTDQRYCAILITLLQTLLA